jgi:hypothetical protein
VWLVSVFEGTKEVGTSLRGSGVITNTFSVSAKRANNRVRRRKSARLMDSSFNATPGLYGCDAQPGIEYSTHRICEALNVMCRGNDHGVGGLPYI